MYLIVACCVDRDQPAMKLFSLLSAIRCLWLPLFDGAFNVALCIKSGVIVDFMVLQNNLNTQ